MSDVLIVIAFQAGISPGQRLDSDFQKPELTGSLDPRIDMFSDPIWALPAGVSWLSEFDRHFVTSSRVATSSHLIGKRTQVDPFL